MKIEFRKTLFGVLGLGLSLALVIGLGVSLAQGTESNQAATVQEPLGTVFTYQGELTIGDTPVDDQCSLAFRLYDAADAGSQVGSAITSTVPITGGLFTVGLDFGQGVFNGDARWLETKVQCTGDTGYTTLGRQPLTAAPYAIYALTAPWSGLVGVPADLHAEIALGGLELTDDVGGTGGSPYTLACPSGSVATGIRGNLGTLEPPSIGGIAVDCTEFVSGGLVVGFGNTTTTAGVGGTSGGPYALSCPAGFVMTGIEGSTKLVFGGFAEVVENLSIQCTEAGGSSSAVVGPAGGGSTTPFDLGCPLGKVVTGIQGNAGQLLDRLQVRCQ
jgi:hypothetical protein